MSLARRNLVQDKTRFALSVIGVALHLSEITVRNYLSNVLEKLSLANRVELAAYAARHHWLAR